MVKKLPQVLFGENSNIVYSAHVLYIVCQSCVVSVHVHVSSDCELGIFEVCNRCFFFLSVNCVLELPARLEATSTYMYIPLDTHSILHVHVHVYTSIPPPYKPMLIIT